MIYITVQVMAKDKSVCQGQAQRQVTTQMPQNFITRYKLLLPLFNLHIHIQRNCIGRLCHIPVGHEFFFQDLSYATQTERFATKLCNFMIRNYIQLSLIIRSIVLSLYTLKILTLSTL